MSEQNNSTRLYLDDLVVGQRFKSPIYEMTEKDIKEFAAAYDPQPFHLDDAAAQSTLFRGLAASGWHTAAVSMRLIVASVPLAGGIIGVGGDIAWPLPTRPNDRLSVTSEVVSITRSASRADRGKIVMRSETRNQRDEVVQVLTPDAGGNISRRHHWIGPKFDGRSRSGLGLSVMGFL